MKRISDIIQHHKDSGNVIISIALSLKCKHVEILTYSELNSNIHGLLKYYSIIDYQRMNGMYSPRGNFDAGKMFSKDDLKAREIAIQKFKEYISNWNRYNKDLGKLRIQEE